MIRLVLSDLDGTLITSKRELTDATRKAVSELGRAGIGFTIVSGRPPLGMNFVTRDLGVSEPFIAFEGAMLVRPNLTICDELSLDPTVAEKLVRKLDELGLDPWVYRGQEWLVRDSKAPHVAREAATVRFLPRIVESFNDAGAGSLERVVKIVGVSDDLELVARAERELRDLCQGAVTAARSQNYYLDITHPQANKGSALERLAAAVKLAPREIATLGDMPSDVPMFPRSGMSFAMGNASESVKSAATHVVASNDGDGFAEAIEVVLKSNRAPRRETHRAPRAEGILLPNERHHGGRKK